MQHCEKLNDDELLNFFQLLNSSYNFDNDNLTLKLKNYTVRQNSENLINFLKLVEPQRREIFRRCNAISRGTIRLVKLRSRLLKLIKRNSDLNAVDFDLVYLFKNWFNRGFLILRPINWETPAHILEKIIAYEAVHLVFYIAVSTHLRFVCLECHDRRQILFFRVCFQSLSWQRNNRVCISSNERSK